MPMVGDVQKLLAEAARQTMADVSDLVAAAESVYREYEQLRARSQATERLQEDLKRAHEGLRQAVEELKGLRVAHQALLQERDMMTKALQELHDRERIALEERAQVAEELETTLRRLRVPEPTASAA
jgi:DNA repair ATPase RecN